MHVLLPATRIWSWEFGEWQWLWIKVLGLACSPAVRPRQLPLMLCGGCCIFASPRAILKTFVCVSARTRMQSTIITITFLLLLLLSRFPFTTEHLCLRLFFPRYIPLNFSRLHVICHHSVGNSALKSPLITEAINSGYHRNQNQRWKVLSGHGAIATSAPAPGMELALAWWQHPLSEGSPGNIFGRLSLDLTRCLLLQADKILFHVHGPSEKENPTHGWNDSTIVTGRPCTVSKDTACLCIKGFNENNRKARLIPAVWKLLLAKQQMYTQAPNKEYTFGIMFKYRIVLCQMKDRNLVATTIKWSKTDIFSKKLM